MGGGGGGGGGGVAAPGARLVVMELVERSLVHGLR